MSIDIFYFSGTGNSLHIARELHKRTAEAKLIPILGTQKKGSVRTTADTVGFIFPQYASRAPKLIEDFIKTLDLTPAQYLFAIATRGGTSCMAFYCIDKILQEKGTRLSMYSVINMPSSSQPLMKSFPEKINQDRINQLESDALNQLDNIQKIIQNKEIFREEDKTATSPTPGWLKPFTPFLLAIGRKLENTFIFYEDSKCTGCGICEKICLADKVKIVDGRPLWQENKICLACWACFNYCPVQSIQIKSKWYLKSYTIQNGRYHHPQISADDIAAQKQG
jgi:NAD-dependent dihydropyrimidine dehydrogenase PreA subunit